LITDDTGTQGVGGNQFETALNRTRDRTSGSETVEHEVPLVYTRGLTQALDLYIGNGRQKISQNAPGTVERGWGNTIIGAKWRFYDDASRKLSFAIKPEVQFPVSRKGEARGLGTARTSYALGLLMTQATAFGVVHANLAAERASYVDGALNAVERRMRYRVSVAPVWSVIQEWALVMDAGLMTNPDRSARARMGYIEAGAIYSPDKNLDLALGVIRHLMDGDAHTLQGTVGLTWRF